MNLSAGNTVFCRVINRAVRDNEENCCRSAVRCVNIDKRSQKGSVGAVDFYLREQRATAECEAFACGERRDSEIKTAKCVLFRSQVSGSPEDDNRIRRITQAVQGGALEMR